MYADSDLLRALQRMILQELEESHDADASPRVEDEQVVILRQDELRRSRQCQREHVVVLRVATVELRVQVRLDALPVPLDASDEFALPLQA